MRASAPRLRTSSSAHSVDLLITVCCASESAVVSDASDVTTYLLLTTLCLRSSVRVWRWGFASLASLGGSDTWLQAAPASGSPGTPGALEPPIIELDAERALRQRKANPVRLRPSRVRVV